MIKYRDMIYDIYIYVMIISIFFWEVDFRDKNHGEVGEFYGLW